MGNLPPDGPYDEAIMDLQTIINVLAGLTLGLVAWVAKELWTAVKELRSDLQRLEVTLPSSYVTKHDFASTLSRIEASLARIEDKLDGKVDK